MKHKKDLIPLEKYNDLLAKHELAKQLGTTAGYFDYYFNILLPKLGSSAAAFEEINELYEKLYNEKRYLNYNSFRRSINYWLKTNQKKT